MSTQSSSVSNMAQSSKNTFNLHEGSFATLGHIFAHLSRRLMGELIGYPCSGVRPSYVVVRTYLRTCTSSSTISNIFFSKTTCPIKAKFYLEPPWVERTKVCSRQLGHMTKMAATPIYGKTLQKSSSETRRADFHETWHVALGNSSPS